MHILEDLAGLSSRAQDLLQRTGCCERPKLARIPTDFLYVRDRAGRSVRAPLSLVIRREGFEQRYGGLHYHLRSTFTMRGERHDRITQWRYDLGARMWADPAGGWFFEWSGQQVSAPVWFALHTDGRAGVTGDGTVFQQTAPSLTALIERHALTDMVSTWERSDPSEGSFVLASYIEGLAEVQKHQTGLPAGESPTAWQFRKCSTTATRHHQANGMPPSGSEATRAAASSRQRPHRHNAKFVPRSGLARMFFLWNPRPGLMPHPCQSGR